VFRLIVPPSHTGDELPAVGVEGTGFIVMVMPELVAVAGLAQPELEVRIQVTTCPAVNAVVEYVALLVPTLLPLTCH
jgi:hypothetical protein